MTEKVPLLELGRKKSYGSDNVSLEEDSDGFDNFSFELQDDLDELYDDCDLDSSGSVSASEFEKGLRYMREALIYKGAKVKSKRHVPIAPLKRMLRFPLNQSQFFLACEAILLTARPDYESKLTSKDEIYELLISKQITSYPKRLIERVCRRVGNSVAIDEYNPGCYKKYKKHLTADAQRGSLLTFFKIVLFVVLFPVSLPYMAAAKVNGNPEKFSGAMRKFFYLMGAVFGSVITYLFVVLLPIMSVVHYVVNRKTISNLFLAEAVEPIVLLVLVLFCSAMAYLLENEQTNPKKKKPQWDTDLSQLEGEDMSDMGFFVIPKHLTQPGFDLDHGFFVTRDFELGSRYGRERVSWACIDYALPNCQHILEMLNGISQQPPMEEMAKFFYRRLHSLPLMFFMALIFALIPSIHRRIFAPEIGFWGSTYETHFITVVGITHVTLFYTILLTMLVSVASVLNSYEEVLGAFDHFNTKESIRSYVRENEELFQIDDSDFSERSHLLDKLGAANKDHLLYYYSMEDIIAKEKEAKRQREERLRRYASGQHNRGNKGENKESNKEAPKTTETLVTKKVSEGEESDEDVYAHGKEMLQNNKSLAKENLNAVLVPWLPLSKPKNLLIWNSMRQAIHDVWQERLNRAPIAFIGVPLLVHIFLGAFVILSELFQVLSSRHYFIIQSIWGVVVISVIAYFILVHGTNVNETEDGFFSKMIDLEISLTANLELLFKEQKTPQQQRGQGGGGRGQGGGGRGQGGKGEDKGGKGQQQEEDKQAKDGEQGDEAAKSPEGENAEKPSEPPKVVLTPEQKERVQRFESFRRQRKLDAAQDEERLDIERQNLNAKLSLIGIIRSHISGNRDPVKILGFEASAEFLSTVVGFYITLGTTLFSMTLLE